ncbi:MAG: hypothetical protein ACRDRI_00485 [Pseudonocardiaceae bacterium]
MTARRRRKSGSGPAATALIAWVGGARASVGESVGAPVSVIATGSCGRVPGGRAVLVGRACGFVAGTLLTCGSVLAGALHVGDGSLVGQSAPLRNPTSTVPGAAADTPDGYRGNVFDGRTSAPPDRVSAQVVADPSPAPRPRLGPVRRNNPASVNVPAAPGGNSGTAHHPRDAPPPSTGHDPIVPVSSVLDPAAKRIGRVAPVGGVLAPVNPRRERKERAGSPRDERVGLYPAMAMLTSLLPTG